MLVRAHFINPFLFNCQLDLDIFSLEVVLLKLWSQEVTT